MKKISKRLMMLFAASLVLEVIIVLLYESQIILEGGYAGNNTAEFIVATVMELLTIIVVPVSLKMIKYGTVQSIIRQQREKGLYKVARFRMFLIILPMLVNTLCYYLFMNVAFLYLAIVLVITLVFIVPTEKRCEDELEVE